jgi:chemotaxis protein histidine kinase CheA
MTGDVGDLLPLFVDEAGSRLDHLAILLVVAANDADAAVQVRRELHALKGAARMMGLTDFADLCHQAEDCMVGEPSTDVDGARAIADRLADMLVELGAASIPGTAVAVSDERSPRELREAGIRGGSGELRVATRVVDGLADRAARMRVSTRASAGRVNKLFELARLAERGFGDRSPQQVVAALSASIRHFALELEGATRGQNRLAEEQLDAVLRLQVQPLRPFLTTLARHTRELALSLGKQVEVSTSGGDVQLDRRILDAIREAALHLVRNAVDHGIEDAGTRIEAGKSPEASIHLGAEADGDRVRLVVSDDGSGIDPEQVIALAVERGLIDPAAAARLTPEEAHQLLYVPGFTTRELATEVSGRGVGLDAVAASVRAAGGDIWIRSKVGEGSRITVEVPVTRRGERVLLVRVGQLVLALPSAVVRSFRRLSPDNLVIEGGRTLVDIGHARIGAILLSRLFGEAGADDSVLVEANVGGTPTAIVVDAVIGSEEVFVRPLPAIAGAPRIVEGVALIAAGRPVAVLSLQRMGALESAASTAPELGGRRRQLRVLLVEDSTVTREMIRRLLEDGGFVVTAVPSADEALLRLESTSHDCVVTDIEMPGLSGLELTDLLRSSDRFSDLPVVVVSTRDRPADRLAGLEAGADAYCSKQGLDARELVNLVRRIAGGSR